MNDFNKEQESIELIIRQAEVSDARAILALMKEVTAETPYLVSGSGGDSLTVERQKDRLLQYIDSTNSVFLVAEVDDQIVGVANLSNYANPKESHVAELGISVVKEYWGYGIGTHLVEELLHFAKHSDLKVISLEVVMENQRAIRMYHKFGFQEVGRLSYRLFHNYRYYDTIIMEKIL